MSTDEKKTKFLILGLDGATWDCIRPWIRKDELPFLKKLYKEGASGILESAVPTQTAVSWTSFRTGVNPAKHGIFDFFKIKNKKLTSEIVDFNDVRALSFWNYLERINKRAVSVNLPVTYPPPHTESVLISGFLTPPGAHFSNDYKIEEKLKELDYEIDLEVGEDAIIQSKNINKKTLFNEVVGMTKKRVEACNYLAKNENWDLFFVLFKETDIIQHFFFGEKENLKYWKILDSLLEDFHKQVSKREGDNLCTIVVSDHGFHKAPTYNFNVYAWLRKNGFLEKDFSVKKVILSFGQKLYLLLRKIGIDLLNLPIFAEQSTRVVIQEGEDSPVAASGYGLFLKGDLHSESIKQEIISKLSSYRHKGEKVFQFVIDSKEYYSGPFLDDAPDIIFLTNSDYLVATSPFSEMVIRKRAKEDVFGGEHLSALEGLFIFHGSFVRRTRSLKAKIYDVIPTVLGILGYPGDEEFDGQFLEKILKKDFLAKVKTGLHGGGEKDKIQKLIDSSIESLD